MSERAIATMLVALLSTYGREPTAEVLRLWLATLRHHDEGAIARACERWVTAERRPPVPADLLAMLEPRSRWPSADEAWAVVAPVLGDETASVVWCAEMARAAGEVEGLTDPVAARMAFRAAYDRLVGEARTRGDRPRHYLSPGWSAEGPEAAVRDAVQRGWLPAPEQHPALEAPGQMPIEVKQLADRLRGH